MSDERETPQRQSLRPSASGQGGSTGGARPTTGSQRAGAATTAAKGTSESAGKGKGNGKKGKNSEPWKPQKAKWKVWTKRILIGILVAGLLAVTAVFVALYVMYSKLETPEPAQFALYEQSTVYYDDGTTIMGTLGEAEREILTQDQYDELPDYVGNAIVAAEDRSFWTNPGVDIMGTARALYKTVIKGDRQGGSTISQQYVERYYSGETVTDIPGKINEALLALKINTEQEKDEILLNYMNTIYLGRGAYGIEKAAEEYFDKDASELTLSEAALIAGVIPAPSAWDPRVDADQAEYRWNYVLDGMVDAGFITQEERDAQVFPETIEYTRSNTFGGTKGYLIRAAIDEVVASTDYSEEDIETLGLDIVTTINKKDQKAAVQAVKDMPDDHDDGLMAATVTVESETGAITSMYGGSDYLERQRNGVTQDQVQAGSTFKPFALIAGLEQGIGLDTKYLANSGMTFGDYGPVNNFGHISYGWVDLVEATQKSINTAFVQLGLDVGADAVVQTAIDAGIPEDTTDLHATPSVVLGPAAVHPIDIAEAYATIANGGVHNDTYMVQTIKDADGATTYEHDTTSRRVFDEDVIADTTYAMQQVVLYGSGKTANSLGRDIAGKTGTSNDNKSALFAAFTPQVVGVVALYQIGENGEAESITPFGGYSQITGSTVPTDVWTEMMGTILEDYDVEEFPGRANVGEASHTAKTTEASPEPSETTTSTEASPEPSETTTTPEKTTSTPAETTTTPEKTTSTPAETTTTPEKTTSTPAETTTEPEASTAPSAESVELP
ncbi:transglycosylase domain-containing protein [Demequina salsinemoris]|uniref:transglycosylase domain-containing protein n=1 Tax=Demequina salsinemoris TaxID=577470 RepID=UPI0007865D3A|nr:transglycosylase domain-containing protein [Demequina salsinemoris]